MLVRIAIGVGLLALGYFVGREMGRNESARKALPRSTAEPDEVSSGPIDTGGAGDSSPGEEPAA